MKLIQEADSLSLVFDEQSDTSDDSVIHVLAIPQSIDGTLKAILLASDYLEATNSVTVSQTIIRICHEWSIAFDKVVAVVSDGAAYCTKAFNDALKCILPNAVHLICNAHILSLVSDEWRGCFPEVDEMCAKIKRVFCNSAARKRRYREHLSDQGCTDVRNPPVPVVTRWTSWFSTVKYHAGHFNYCKSFFEAELEQSDTATLRNLCSLLEQPQLQREVAFIAEHCERLSAVLTAMETSATIIHTIYDKVRDLLA